jgi:hypothetical protein
MPSRSEIHVADEPQLTAANCVHAAQPLVLPDNSVVDNGVAKWGDVRLRIWLPCSMAGYRGRNFPKAQVHLCPWASPVFAGHLVRPSLSPPCLASLREAIFFSAMRRNRLEGIEIDVIHRSSSTRNR